MVRQHLERNLAFYGPHKGLILFRKHALQYLKLQHLPRAMRTRIILQDTAEGFLSLLDEAYAALGEPAVQEARQNSYYLTCSLLPYFAYFKGNNRIFRTLTILWGMD
jgi:hypothetical protein